MLDSFILIFLVALLVGFVISLSWGLSLIFQKKKYQTSQTIYKYYKKEKIMTKREEIFFFKLRSVCGENILIFPQVYLSVLFDYKKNGRYSARAFNRISRKSVDFVLCSAKTLHPFLAIELDDSTHDTKKRRERDLFVNTIFENANLPLFRTRDVEIEPSELKKQILEHIKK